MQLLRQQAEGGRTILDAVTCTSAITVTLAEKERFKKITLKSISSRRWFQYSMILWFYPYPGKWSNLASIFQMGLKHPYNFVSLPFLLCFLVAFRSFAVSLHFIWDPLVFLFLYSAFVTEWIAIYQTWWKCMVGVLEWFATSWKLTSTEACRDSHNWQLALWYSAARNKTQGNWCCFSVSQNSGSAEIMLEIPMGPLSQVEMHISSLEKKSQGVNMSCDFSWQLQWHHQTSILKSSFCC